MGFLDEIDEILGEIYTFFKYFYSFFKPSGTTICWIFEKYRLRRLILSTLLDPRYKSHPKLFTDPQLDENEIARVRLGFDWIEVDFYRVLGRNQ